MARRCRIPTTTNAISVDRENWRAQGVAPAFGEPAARLADAYVAMGCRPSFTCAPYLLDSAPRAGECVAWAESNAVAVRQFRARRAHRQTCRLSRSLHRADRPRAARRRLSRRGPQGARAILEVERPEGADDSFWPLLGYLAGRAAPDRIPLLRGLAGAAPSRDDLKALCAAFGTTSAAPMLHIEGVTPEAGRRADGRRPRDASPAPTSPPPGRRSTTAPSEIDLVAIGSPHASLDECRALADALGGGGGATTST